MWISKKKWSSMEKRITDLEKKVQDQPEEIIIGISQQLKAQMAKSNLAHRQK